MKILSTKKVYTSRYFNVQQNTIERNGKTFVKDFVKRNSVVMIIPYTKDYEIYLEKQFRESLGKTIIEIVAGTIEQGDDPLETAKRELQEETGLTAKKWQQLAVWEVSANMQAKIYLFVATELSEGKQNLEEDEEIETFKLPLEGALEKIRKGEITVASHIAALYLFERLRSERKL